MRGGAGIAYHQRLLISRLVQIQVRHFTSHVPEPPTKRSVNFDATIPPSSPHRFQPQKQRNMPPQPYFPNKENIQEYLEDLKTNITTFKVHKLLNSNLLLPEDAHNIFEMAKEKHLVSGETYSLYCNYFKKRNDIEGVKNVLGLAEQDRMFIFPPYIASLIPFLLEKDVAHAESTFKSIMHSRDHAFHAYRYMLRFYFYGSKLNEFDTTLQAMINGRIRIPDDVEATKFINWLFYTLMKMGRSAACARVYSEVRKTRIVLTSDTYANVIRCCDKDDSESVKQVMEDMKQRGVDFDLKTLMGWRYYPLLRALNRHDTHLAKKLGDDMLRSGAPIDVRTLNAYLHVCVREANPSATQDALNAFNRFKNSGLTPDLLSYLNLLKACGRVGDVATCYQLMEELQTSGLQITFTPEAFSSVFSVVPTEVGFKILEMFKKAGVKPDVVMYNMILKRADIDTASQVREKMNEDEIEPDLVTYNTLMGVYARTRNLEKCQELLQEMDKKSIVPDVWAFNSMIPALAHDQPTTAVAWLQQMRDRGVSPDEVTYNALFANLLRRTKESFVPLWEDMNKNGVKPSVYTFNLYVKARGQAGEAWACEEILNEMRARELEPDVVTYTTCFDYITDEVVLHRLLEQMNSQGVAPGIPTYVSLLRQCARAGDSAWAKELVLDAQRRGLLDSEQTTLLENVLEGEDGVKHLHEKLSAMFSKDTPST